MKELYMYTNRNFQTKKSFKEAVKNGEQVSVYQPGGMFEGQTDGEVTLEGPHYPQPHKWYSRVRIVDSVVVKVIS